MKGVTSRDRPKSEDITNIFQVDEMTDNIKNTRGGEYLLFIYKHATLLF
jgi:hypothetical protein